MPHLEPTYLRYIYDGLLKGSIHPENAAELPEGLIGLYEEAFDERTSVIERQKLLKRFAILALLKKEVSAAFVAEVLGETEYDIQDFISTYSSWFNSPESGKYQLYHERLKVYLLQKLSEGEVHALHEKLIVRLEKAIQEQKADEFEWYGLEFLAGHLALVAMLNGDGKKLIELAYFQAHWQRQLKISKGLNWTKNGLKAVMTWASKYNDDEVIECGLQMVDLHHQEQNAAPQIVALVAEGEFDAALKRIEQFGGNDKEGLQRKFILYMLCLMELTLLDSKDKPNRKVGIEKLLKHLDEQLQVDHSVLNWGEFFSGQLIFQMASEIHELGLEFNLIVKRTEDFDFKWIESNGPYSTTAFFVIEKMSLSILDKERKQEFTKYFLVGLANNIQFKHINSMLRKVDIELKDEYLDLIATTLASKRKIEKSIHFALKIKDANDKNLTLIRIGNILLESNKYIEAKEVLPHLTIRYYRVVLLCLFSNYLFKSKSGNHLNALNQAIKISETIQNDSWLIMAKRRIAATLITQRKFSKAFGIISESFKIETNRDEIKNFYLTQLIDLFINEKKYEYAYNLTIALDDKEKNKEIAKILFLKGKKEEGIKLISNKKITCLQDVMDKKRLYDELIIYLLQKGSDKAAINLTEELAKMEFDIIDIGFPFLKEGKIDLLQNVLIKRSSLIFENSIKLFIQIVVDEYNSWRLNDIIDCLLIKLGDFETIKILYWIINNDKLRIVHWIAFRRVIELSNITKDFKKIQVSIFKSLTYKVQPFTQDQIIKKLILHFYTTNSKKLSLKLLHENISIENQVRIMSELLDVEHTHSIIDLEKTREIFLPIIDEISSCDPNIDLSRLYYRLGEILKLEESINSTYDTHTKINKLILIAEFYNKENNVVQSKKYINLAIEEIKNHDNNEDKVSWYHEAATICFNNNDLFNSNKLLKKSIHFLKLMDEDFAFFEVGYIIDLLCKHNQYEDAINLIEESDDYYGNCNYCNLIPLLISNNEEVLSQKIINSAIKQLYKIKLLIAASTGYFGIKNYKKSIRNLNLAIILADDINDLTEQSEAFEAISNEFVNQENWHNAVTFIERVLLKQNKLDLAVSLGKQVSYLKKSEEIELISSYFYNENLKLAIWKGFVKEINLESINLKMIIHNMKRQIWNPNMFIEFYQLEILKQIFMNRFPSDNEEKLVPRLNLEWAIDIKNQLPN